jgi:hypothetical protein
MAPRKQKQVQESKITKVIRFHHLYINEVLFESYTSIAEAFNGFTNWYDRGFDVRLSFEQETSPRRD